MNQTVLPPPQRLKKQYSPDRKESLGEMLEKRNSRLIKLFRDTGHTVKLVGAAEKPIIILDDKIRLTAFVRNFQLLFTDAPDNGKVIYKVKINASNHVPLKFLKVFLREVEQLPAKEKRKRIRKPKKVYFYRHPNKSKT